MLRRTLLALPCTLTLLLGLALPAAAQGQPDSRTWDVLRGGRVRRDEVQPAPATRGPRAWRPAPDRTTSACAPAPARCEPRPWAPAARAQPAATALRTVPRAWRDALPAHVLLEIHRRLLESTQPAARAALVDELARTWAVTVDQVICLVGALPTSCERLAALTRLHPFVVDRAAFGRTYRLLEADDQDVLHVRVTPTLDAETAAQRARIRRLMAEERALERVLGD